MFYLSNVKSVLLILVLFILYSTYKRLYLTVLYENIPVLLWWTPFSGSNRVINCNSGYSCLLTSNRIYKNHSNLGAFLFYGSKLNLSDLPVEVKHIPWSIFHEESPKNLALLLHEYGQSVFNITSTFDRQSDFPITLQYLKNINTLIGRQYYIPLEIKNKLLRKNAPVLYIQSDCNTPIERDEIVSELMEYIEIDSFGSCLNNKKLPDSLKIGNDQYLTEYDEKLMKFVAPYKFTIAIENAECNDYITEKLWRPLIVGSIPIYLGSPTVRDWLPNNHSAILINDFVSIKSLAAFIRLVNKDDKLYLKYMMHKEETKLDQQVTNSFLIDRQKKGNFGLVTQEDDVIPAFECYMCQAMYNSVTETKIKNKNIYNCPEPNNRNPKRPSWWNEHWRRGKCEGKVLEKLLKRRKNYTKNSFDQRVEYYYRNNLC